MSKTTRIATCPFADTYENLRDDNPILRNGQRVYDTKNKKWYTGDGITAFNDLIPDDGEIDLSGYQTIENSSDNYSDPELFKENGYLSQAGAFNLYTEIMAERLSPISADIEELNKKVTTFENDLPSTLDAINTSVSWALDRSKTDGANRYYNTILDFLNETQVDNPDGPGPVIYTEPAFATMMLPLGSIITIATKSIPNLQVLEINSDGFTSDLANIEQTEENLASQINDLLNTNGYFYTKWIKFGKFCDESSGGSEIPQEELEKIEKLEKAYYYNNPDIEITDSQYFTVTNGAIYGNNIDLLEAADIVIPYGLATKIGQRAFRNAQYMGSVTIPQGITEIGSRAFDGCANCSTVIIPDSVTTLQSGAFLNSSISTITLPKTISNIPTNAFLSCSNLQSVTILNSKAVIDDAAFDTSYATVTVIKCYQGSTAEEYALSKGFEVEYIDSSYTSTELSNFIINATGNLDNITCDVTFYEIVEAAESGKTPILKIDSPENLNGTIIAPCVGIYNTEAGGFCAEFRYEMGLQYFYRIICDGPQNRWYSEESSPVVGQTEYINLQMADAANSTKIDQNTTAINDISKNMISKNSNSLLIGNEATIASGTTNNVVIGQAANIYSGDNNIVMGQYSSAGGENNVAIGYSSSTSGNEGVAIGYASTTAGGVAIGASARAFKNSLEGSSPINAIQLGTGTNSNEGTFQVYDYQLLDAEGKIPEERLPEGIGSSSGTTLDEQTMTIVLDDPDKLYLVDIEIIKNINIHSKNLTSGIYKVPVNYNLFGQIHNIEVLIFMNKNAYITYDDNDQQVETIAYNYVYMIHDKLYGSTDDINIYPIATKIIDNLDFDDNGSLYGLSQRQGYELDKKINDLSTTVDEVSTIANNAMTYDAVQNDLTNPDLADELGNRVPPSVNAMKQYISDMFYLDGDNLKISIGGKTFTLTPDSE